MTPRRHVRGQRGFAMAALLVVLAVMSLVLSMALPVWHHAARREREAELIFRGEQYSRAIMLYQRQTPGAYPPDIETLVEGRFLRRAYRDPMTADGEFRLVLQSELATISGTDDSGGAEDDPSGESDSGLRRPSDDAGERPGFMQGIRPFGDRTDNAPGGVDGNVVGVVSRSERTSIALYNGKSKYSEWVFVGSGPTTGAGEGDAAQPEPGLPGSSGPPAPRRGRSRMGGLP